MDSETRLEQDRARLVAQLPWLQLLMVHLAGPGVLRRVERDDLVQETLLRALGGAGAPPREDGEAVGAGR